MLKFIGFIALLAIIFGVSFGTALTGFLKFVLIGFLVIILIGFIIKLLESFKGAILVLVGAIVAVALGVNMINDPANSVRINVCHNLVGAANMDCMVTAYEAHNETVNQGWGYIICGGIAGICALAAIGGDDMAKPKNNTKTHSVAGSSKPLSKKS